MSLHTVVSLLARLLGVLALLGLPLAAAAAPPLATVPALDLDRYAGRWYEVAKLPNWFQRKCERDTTATYARRPDGQIEVINRCAQADGTVDEISGVARVPDAAAPAKLEVSFVPGWLRWTGIGWGRYWVIALADDYRYAVIGEPSREYLWVLARTPTLSDADRAAVDAALVAAGYAPSQLVPSPHTATR